MRAKTGRLCSFGALSISIALVVMGCAGSGSPGNGQSGTGGQALAGKSGQGSGGAGTGGAGTGGGAANGTGGGTAIGTGGNGDPSGSATGGSTGGTSTGVDASGTAGSGGSFNLDGSAKGGADGGVDAAPATNDATTSSAGCTGFLFCDDFESYTTGAAPSGKWTTQARGSAKALVDTTMSFSGTRSVHFTGTVNQSSANIIAQGAPFPIQGNTVFIRMMMYTKTYPATGGTHSRLMRIGMSTNGQDGSAYALDTYNGVGIEHINSGMFRDTGLHLGDSVVTGKWVCWEWELDNTAGPPTGDTGTVMAYLWRDGTALPLAVTHDSLPWNPIPWALLEVGLEAYQPDTVPGDFWIDDIVVNNKKIGCPTK